jgi:hypothetical protein
MSQRLLPRMIALLVVTILGVYFITIDVMQYRIGPQRFTVTAYMPNAGGLYPGADVNYRGVGRRQRDLARPFDDRGGSQDGNQPRRPHP